jgi:hypothetical protein
MLPGNDDRARAAGFAVLHNDDRVAFRRQHGHVFRITRIEDKATQNGLGWLEEAVEVLAMLVLFDRDRTGWRKAWAPNADRLEIMPKGWPAARHLFFSQPAPE